MAHRHAKTLSSCPERLPTSPPAWDEATAFVCPSGRWRVGRVGAGSGGVAGGLQFGKLGKGQQASRFQMSEVDLTLVRLKRTHWGKRAASPPSLEPI